MPPPATAQAISAPNTPVALPNRRGSMKMPDPIIDPTTMAVRAGRAIFWVDGAAAAGGDSADGDVVVADMAPPRREVERFVIPGPPARAASPARARRRSRRGAPRPRRRGGPPPRSA